MPPEDAPFIFLQMTRSAGNATIAILLEEFGGDGLYVLGPRTPYADFRRAAARATHRGYAGHFLFGAHRHVARPCRYFTTLRYPVDQLLSRYEAVCRRTGRRLDCADWLERDFESKNGMVKRLVGVGMLPGDRRLWDAVAEREAWPDFEVGAAEYEQAVRNLESRFSCVLFTEHFTESMVLLRGVLGTGPLFSLHRQFVNRAAAPILRWDYPAAVIEKIMEQNPWDLKLYETWRKRFIEDIAARGAAFHGDVATMRLVSQALRAEDAEVVDGARALAGLITLVNRLGREGRRGDAVKVIGMFTAKSSIDREFCRSALSFVRAHGGHEDFHGEVDKYLRRFGNDDFLAALTAAK